MLRRNKILIFAAIVLAVVGTHPVFAQQVKGVEDIMAELQLFSKTLGAILEGYVDDVKPRQMFYEAVRGMMKSLDPYSEFIDPEKFELMQIGLKGEYAGIGTWIKSEDGFILIEKINEGSAADKAGLLVNDKILKIDGVEIKGKEVAEVGKMLRGEAAAPVKLQIGRLKKVFDVTINREIVQIEAVKDVRIVGRAIGYMEITDFQEKTDEQAAKALEKLEKDGMKALIIDLRGNPGGLFPQAIGLAQKFLPKGTKLVSVNSKLDVQRQDYSVTSDEKRYEIPMIILVNEMSASASEVFSACMQDHKRATIVGKKTYGKASVQSLVPLDDKAAMKLTTARYVSPNGRKIDGVGIEPDVVVDDGTPDNPQAQNQIKAALEIFKEYF
jgi:carboxyl-terminal processing protease